MTTYDNISQDASKYALTPEGQAMVNNQKDLSATQSSVYDAQKASISQYRNSSPPVFFHLSEGAFCL